MKKSNGHVEDLRIGITAVNPAPVLIKGIDSLLNGNLNEAAAEAIAEQAARMRQAANHVGPDSRIPPRNDSSVYQKSGDGVVQVAIFHTATSLLHGWSRPFRPA